MVFFFPLLSPPLPWNFMSYLVEMLNVLLLSLLLLLPFALVLLFFPFSLFGLLMASILTLLLFSPPLSYKGVSDEN